MAQDLYIPVQKKVKITLNKLINTKSMNGPRFSQRNDFNK